MRARPSRQASELRFGTVLPFGTFGASKVCIAQLRSFAPRLRQRFQRRLAATLPLCDQVQRVVHRLASVAMQATLAATAATADGTSLLALAYHNHVVLYNTTTNTRIDLSPLPGIKSTASSTTAADEDEDDEDNGEDEAGGEAAEEQEGKDEQQLAEPKLAKVGQSDAQPKARTHKPLSTIDIMHAQNTLTAIRVLLFSPDAQRLAVADDNKRVTLYDTPPGALAVYRAAEAHCHGVLRHTRASRALPSVYELMVADKAGDIHRVVFTADLSRPRCGTGTTRHTVTPGYHHRRSPTVRPPARCPPSSSRPTATATSACRATPPTTTSTPSCCPPRASSARRW